MEVHRGSKETFDYISKWIASDFFFSSNDKWDRMGFLGMFGDYVLSCTFGDILEIGVGESSIYLSHLARKYNRKIYHCDISASKIDNPLTVEGYLAPERSVFFRGASDDMFKNIEISTLALGFIDGDHTYEQSKKDFYNLLPKIVDHGFIILHDTYPPDNNYIHENACGEVYRLRQELEKDPNLGCLTLTRGTAMGVGLTICRKKPMDRKYYHE